MRSQRLMAAVNLTRTHTLGSEEVKAIDNVSLDIFPGQFVTIVGRSGSGKTSLLNVMAGLDEPSSGQVLFQERDLSEMSPKELTDLRRHKIGFVFQSFGLLPLLSAFENVELPLRISGVKANDREIRVREALEIVGLWDRSHHRPYELSGGEQQRIAIARAIIVKPDVILADEPTGNLDSNNAFTIFGLFKNMVEENGISVVAATHDSTLLSMADEVMEIRNGALLEQAEVGLRFRD